MAQKDARKRSEDQQVTVVGGGPAGSYAAGLLAKQGHEVRVIEEHSSIGNPVQCTGIVTKRLGEIVRLRKDFVVNRLNKVRVHAPCGDSTEIKINDIVIDRTRFDQHIAEQAKKQGAKIILNNRVTGITDGKTRAINKKTHNTSAHQHDILVGADGPNSIVSRYIGNRKPEFWIGVQAVVKMREIPGDSKTYSVYFGDDIPGFFGWLVPEDETTARVGIATSKNPKKVFQRFMKRMDRCKIIEMQGGLIPKYDPQLKLEKDNTYLVGDAATQVKATTGGGLVPGLKAAECLSRAIERDASYRKELCEVNRELRMSLLLRSILDKFNEKDHDRLIEIINNEKMKKVLNTEDRDRPSRIVFKSIIKEPKLLLFSKTLLRAKRL